MSCPLPARTCTLSLIFLLAPEGLTGCSKPPVAQNAIVPDGITAKSIPTLRGQPPLSVQAGQTYVFVPIAADADGETLTFWIANRPNWARFDMSTGRLTGVPTAIDEGRYDDIRIFVSDGASQVALPAFSLVVTAPGRGTGTATLRWKAPARNMDGSPLTDLAGFWIYEGSSPTSLLKLRPVADPAATGDVVGGLEAGRHYFGVAAYTAAGVDGLLSDVMYKDTP